MHKLIEGFIQGRLQDKLEKLKPDDPKREELIASHAPIAWIDDAARRVKWIQLVTHAAKFHHPDTKSSSIYAPNTEKSNSQRLDPFVSSNTPHYLKPDVVGNAAALDVFKFLQLEHEGESILSRACRNCPELLAALPGITEQKQEWLAAFASIKNTDDKISSHTFAKQVYFPINDQSNEYRLLSPMFPTALVQYFYETIQEKKFGDQTNEAKVAKGKEQFHELGYSECWNMAIQKFGGSKPQNISQHNSKRAGKAYLLASCPPMWQSQDLKPPLTVAQLEKKLTYLTREPCLKLKAWYQKYKKSNNIAIREDRAEYISEILDQILDYGFKLQELESGWTAQSTCELSEAEQFWLDPHRIRPTSEGKDWQEARERSNWRSDIAEEIARWLSGTLRIQLETNEIGADEEWEFKKDFRKELNLMVEAFE